MVLDQQLPLTRRTPDWPVAVVSGLAAGAVLMVLDLVWSTVIVGGPWRTSHMIAPVFSGVEAARAGDFSVPVVATALGVHYLVGIVFALVLAAIMTPFGLDATPLKALVAGALFGVAIYLVNFHGVVQVFPWLAEMRGWATLAAHLVFGIVAALLYWKLGRTEPEA